MSEKKSLEEIEQDIFDNLLKPARIKSVLQDILEKTSDISLLEEDIKLKKEDIDRYQRQIDKLDVKLGHLRASTSIENFGKREKQID